MITFKCVVGGDAPLSVSLASNSEVCLVPSEQLGSWSQSGPSGSSHTEPGGLSDHPSQRCKRRQEVRWHPRPGRHTMRRSLQLPQHPKVFSTVYYTIQSLM